MIYGIDLGTTYSAIAHVNPLNEPVCVPLQEGGGWTLPSAVLFVEEKKVYVGQAAIDESWQPNSLLVEFAKRDIGLHNSQGWKYKGWQYTPEEISALVLRKVAQQVNAERTMAPVQDVVVSHPQYFWMNQKEATSKAVELAGLNLVATITEPNAAAIAYGVFNPADDETEKTVLVFDLGGGTFDVTIVRIGGKRRFRMLGSDGDARLGGMNWDAEIVRLAKETYSEHYKEDFDDASSDEEKIALRKAAERAKIELSKPDRAAHRFRVEANNEKMFIELSKADFEARCRPLVARCMERCERLFQKTGLGWGQLDEVLLVGSSTRMPMVQESVRAAFGKEPLIDKEPKLMVAKGAAIWGDWVRTGSIDARWGEADEAQVAGLTVHEHLEVSGCTAHGLGVMAKRGGDDIIKVLVQQNAQTPCEVEQTFYTDRDGATAVLVPLYEGESDEPEHCLPIGDARLDGLPPRPKDQPVRVRFRIDVAGRLEVRVVDVETGREEVKTLDRSVLRGGNANQGPDWEARRKHLSEIVVM